MLQNTSLSDSSLLLKISFQSGAVSGAVSLQRTTNKFESIYVLSLKLIQIIIYQIIFF